jgi:hypothetical protein
MSCGAITPWLLSFGRHVLLLSPLCVLLRHLMLTERCVPSTTRQDTTLRRCTISVCCGQQQ